MSAVTVKEVANISTVRATLGDADKALLIPVLNQIFTGLLDGSGKSVENIITYTISAQADEVRVQVSAK